MRKVNLDRLLFLLMLEYFHPTSIYIEERSTIFAPAVTHKTPLGVTVNASGSLLDVAQYNLM